jgi:signal transduction histidine kinase/CheY-like chemotaxis protein
MQPEERMLDSWFDERFRAAAARDHRQSGVRLAVMLGVAALLTLGADWRPALAWTACAALLEAPLRALLRPLAGGARPSHLRAFATVILQLLLTCVWIVPGVVFEIFGGAGGAACAASYFAALLLYLVGRGDRSATAMITAAPALAAPLVAALMFPALFGAQAVILALAALTGGLAGLALLRDRRPGAEEALSVESLREAKAQAEAASQAKSAFLATMSHEIRTPLNGVLGMTQALAADPSLTPNQRAKLETIRKSGESLLAILNDVLDLSKIEAGKLELECIEFDLEDIARGAHASFKTLAAQEGLEFKLVIDPGAKGAYLGDPTRVRQVLYNLISNALKFTERGEIRVLIEPAGRAGLRLTVADTGIGIEPAQLERIFGKFEQADASSTRQYGGSGLGLAICRELCGLMKGSIIAESEVGRGTSFIVTLPLPKVGNRKPAAPPARLDEAPQETDVSGLRVLAAEDNPVNQLVLKAMLAPIGIEPVIVENGALALETWAMSHFDLILMDIQMPQMDGIEATRAIRHEEAKTGRKRTPIVALTANAMSHQVAEYFGTGMDAHIAKPIDRRTLSDTIEKLVQAPEAAGSAASAGRRRQRAH